MIKYVKYVTPIKKPNSLFKESLYLLMKKLVFLKSCLFYHD